MNCTILLAVVVCLCAPALAHATMFTPTASSQFAAGIGLWGVIWSAIFKIEALAKFVRLERYVNKEGILAWIRQNQVVALLLTEVFNFGVHGLESASGVTFALGGTFTNIWMIFIIVPLRQWKKERLSL